MPDIPDVMQAKAFQLVDDNGSVRAEMKLTEDGSPQFILRDQDGGDRLVAYIDEWDNPGLSLYSQGGKTRFDVSLPDGVPGLSLHDEDGRIRSEVSVDESGEPNLILYDRDGRIRFDVSLDDSGAPGLFLHDQDSKPRLSAFLGESGRPSLDLYDQDNHPRLSASLDRIGQPGLYLRDASGAKRLILGTDVDYDRFSDLFSSGKLYEKGSIREWYMNEGLYILDGHGQTRFAAYVEGDDGRSWLYLADQENTDQIVAIVGESQAHLSLRRKDADNMLSSEAQLVAELDEHSQPILYLTKDTRETIVAVDKIKKNQPTIKRVLGL